MKPQLSKPDGRTGDFLASSEFCSADGAVDSLDPEAVLLLEDGFDSFVEARLTEIVHRLRGSWIGGPAGLWGDIHAIHNDVRGQLEKRVTATLREGFLQFSQLLCGFEVLLLKLHELRVVREQSVLGLEQLLVDLSDSSGRLIEIAERQSRLTNLLRGLERADGDADRTEVHEVPR